MNVKKTLDELFAMGLAVNFTDPEGTERIRLTPAGARQQGDETLAKQLEECAAGRHFLAASYRDRVTQWDAPSICPCGEKKLWRK